jgi:hypothetical protein
MTVNTGGRVNGGAEGRRGNLLSAYPFHLMPKNMKAATNQTSRSRKLESTRIYHSVWLYKSSVHSTDIKKHVHR